MAIEDNISRTFNLGCYREPMVALFRMIMGNKEKEEKTKYGYLEFSIDGGLATHHDFAGFNYLGEGMFELPAISSQHTKMYLQIKIVTPQEAETILSQQEEEDM